jgi:hypothetical protein
MSAQDLVRQQAKTLRTLLGDNYRAFDECVAVFDFEAALAFLNNPRRPDKPL